MYGENKGQKCLGYDIENRADEAYQSRGKSCII